MTGKYSIYWQIVFSFITLYLVWIFIESGNLKSILLFIFNIFLMWLKLFTFIPDFFQKSVGDGFFGILLAIFWSFLWLSLIIGLPVYIFLWTLMLIIDPFETSKLIYSKIKEQALTLLIFFFVGIISLLIIAGIAISSEYGVNVSILFGLIGILLGLFLINWILDTFFNIDINRIIKKLKIYIKR